MSEINDLSRWSENVCFSRGQTLILGIDRAPKVSNSIGGIQADVSWILLSDQKSLMHVKLLFFFRHLQLNRAPIVFSSIAWVNFAAKTELWTEIKSSSNT